jgi:general secretion pathway protein A
MYIKWFGLREFPFNLSCNPRFIYATRTYQESYTDLRYGIKLRKGLIVLTGESGTGKTSLIKMVQDRFESTIHMAVVSGGFGRDFAGLLRLTMQAFGLKEIPADRQAKIQRFKAYLIDQLKQGHIVAVAIDEAQELDLQRLNELKSIAELQSADQNLCQIVLAGQPELTTKLNSPGLRSFRKRVAVWREIGPLKPDEIGAYIENRLVVAAYQGKGLFEPDAVEQIAVYSGGIPRLINVICDNACLFAYKAEENTITAGTIRKVCDHLRLTGECSPSEKESPPLDKQSEARKLGRGGRTDGEEQLYLKERIESKRDEKRVSSDPHFDQILRFVDERLTDSGATPNLFERVFEGVKENDKPASLVHAELKPSGLVKRDHDGNLIIRNRISKWLQSVKPKRELQRTRRFAYGVTTVLLVTLLGSGIYYQQVVAPQKAALAGRENLRSLGVTLQEKSGLVIASFPERSTDAILSEAVQDLAEITASPGRNNWLVLRLRNSSVTDLAPLEKLTNLHSLSLDATQVSNLMPLEKLTNLQWLSLDATQVSNLMPLEKLTNLRFLDLSRMKNLRPEQLKAMQSLQLLVVDASRVQEFERSLNRPGLVIRPSR